MFDFDYWLFLHLLLFLTVSSWGYSTVLFLLLNFRNNLTSNIQLFSLSWFHNNDAVWSIQLQIAQLTERQLLRFLSFQWPILLCFFMGRLSRHWHKLRRCELNIPVKGILGLWFWESMLIRSHLGLQKKIMLKWGRLFKDYWLAIGRRGHIFLSRFIDLDDFLFDKGVRWKQS